MCKVLENRAQQDEERMDQLTNQLKEARLLAEDADNKSDEVSRKLAFVEDELEVAEDRVKGGDAKIMELEEELKVVGNSLKSLEVSEEKANQRVEEFKKQLKSLTVKLKEAEARAEFAEKTVKKLQKEVDRLEGALLHSTDVLLIAFYMKVLQKVWYTNTFRNIFPLLCFLLLNPRLLFCFSDFVLREKNKYIGIVTDIDKTFVEMSSLGEKK